MFEATAENTGMAAKDGRMTPGSRLPRVSDEMKKHLRENYPMLLDGALRRSSPRRPLESHALRGLTGPEASPSSPRRYSGAVLRELLAAARGDPRHIPMAALTPVAPRKMWVWWSPDLLAGRQDDIVAGLASPRPVLRFYDVTGLPSGSDSWNQVFDIDADAVASAQNVEFWAADRAYVVDLGLLAADGRFVRLARTNPARLPRETPGPPGTGVTRIEMSPEAAPRASAPDAEATAWFDAGQDWPARDRDAELTIRMLYRTFLTEGPRALRRMRGLAIASRPDLEREHRFRAYHRAQRVSAAVRRDATEPLAQNRVMIALLDSRKVFLPSPPFFAIARQERPAWATVPTGRGFAFFHALLEATKREQAAFTGKMLSCSMTAEMKTCRVVVDASPWVRPAPEKFDELFAGKTVSIFDAARGLSRELARTASSRAGEGQGGRPTPRPGTPPDIGGSEGGRPARRGARTTPTALSLEGRARPGARFKVGGKVVRANTEGRFRVNCRLSGGRTGIPLLGVSPLGLSAKNAVAVEWGKAGSPHPAASRKDSRPPFAATR